MAAVTVKEVINFTTLNFLRFTALATGLGYGIYRQGALTRQVAKEKAAAEDRHHRALAEEGKIAYQAMLDRQTAEKAAKQGVVTDINSYKFSTEQYINFMVAEMEKEAAADNAAKAAAKKK
ncbi:hypothetical protein BJ742DRAFT_786055 [Cladochytrium replicatum]|nr:hypothetical protein BJ742DRAFT_786055 [Cladochytrium replicatum]